MTLVPSPPPPPPPPQHPHNSFAAKHQTDVDTNYNIITSDQSRSDGSSNELQQQQQQQREVEDPGVAVILAATNNHHHKQSIASNNTADGRGGGGGSSSSDRPPPPLFLPTWRELLTVGGVELWTIRSQRAFFRGGGGDTNSTKKNREDHDGHADGAHQQKKTNQCVALNMGLAEKTKNRWWLLPSSILRRIARSLWVGGAQQEPEQKQQQQQVMVIGCPHLFCQIEKEQDDRQEKNNKNIDNQHSPASPFFHGLDKPDTSGIRSARPRPLNVCVGEEWKRQRFQVQSALSNLPQRSLHAARNVPFSEMVAKYTINTTTTTTTTTTTRANSIDHQQTAHILVDWRQVAVDVAVLWVVQLFRGHSDTRLEAACMTFWEAARSFTPVPAATLEKRRKSFAHALLHVPPAAVDKRRTGDQKAESVVGVFDSLLQSGLSESEAVDNAINAMIAALDAVQALLFWTVWNISKTPKGWKNCQEEQSSSTSINIHHKKDLEGLAQFKKAATHSQKVDYSQLSYLGRALCETVRVFPPVWTLPRTWPGKPGESDIVPELCCPHLRQQQQQEKKKLNDFPAAPPRPPPIRWSKLEVSVVNAATSHQDWDPDGPMATTPHSTYVASFGLGRRHCPGGTAALYAVYHFLSHGVFQKTSSNIQQMTEHVPNHALESVHLLPTLSVVGPQWFRVVYYTTAVDAKHKEDANDDIQRPNSMQETVPQE